MLDQPAHEGNVALDYEDGHQRLRELADRLDRTEVAVPQLASGLPVAKVEGDVV